MMIASAIKLLSGLAVVLSVSTPALSATQLNQGVIQITGQIVDDPCVVSPRQQTLEISCYQQGKMQSRNVSYRAASGVAPVNAAGMDISMRYLDPEKKRAIIQVSYP